MVEYLKKAPKTARTDATDVRNTVMEILDDIEARGDEGALEYAKKFDGYEGNILLSDEDQSHEHDLV